MPGLSLPRLFVVAGLVAATACSDRHGPTTPLPPSRGRVSHDLTLADFTVIAFPGATATFPLDINEHGVIVGRYAKAGVTHGFVRDADGGMTTVDFPGASFTLASSITDSGAVLGWYSLPVAPGVRHGFLLKDGTFSSFDPPGSTFTNPIGINNRGDISGRFCTLNPCHVPGSGDFHGFLLQDGQLSYIDVPGAVETNPFKITENGTIGGGYTRPDRGEGLFVLSSGEFTTFDLPNGMPITQDNGGINSRGDIVGGYCNAAPPCAFTAVGTHGFLLSDGQLTTVDYPGALSSMLFGINVQGDIVGAFFDNGGQAKGFLLSRRPPE